MDRPKNSFVVVLFACALLVDAGRGSAAWAEGSSKSHGEGGYVPDFLAILRQYNASGEPFRIEGTCKSACTMFLGIRNACLERNSTLIFHAGHDIKENITGPNTRTSRALLFRVSLARNCDATCSMGITWTPMPTTACLAAL